MDQKFSSSTAKIGRGGRRGKKIIKRYSNRKLYDTEKSSYVVLSDIGKMIRNEENLLIIDNETKEDITASTLTQIIFNAEREASEVAPLHVLKAIIKGGDGSFSSYLCKRNIKPQIQDSAISIKEDRSKGSDQVQYSREKQDRSPAFQHKTLKERVVNATLDPDSLPDSEDTILPTSRGGPNL